jgi:DNA topoisomerase I
MPRRGGWRRRGSAPRFRYVDARGNPITDEAHLERVRSLVIPPAWRDVWISPNPGAKLQATGVDRAGRTQYLYHPDYRAAQEEAKFDRLVRFGELLPGLRRQARADIQLEPCPLDWTCAIGVTLINRGWFRVGSDRHTRTGRTYGVTTLFKRHVTVNGHRLTLHFRSKNRTLVRTTLLDATLARAVGDLLSLPGSSRLFRFERDGELVNLTAPVLNEYIGQHLGEGFTAKDFRTWGGTLTAAIALAEHGPAASDTEAKRVLSAVMRRVGKELGNTPAVARASYVSPAVVEQFLEGRTLSHFRPTELGKLSARTGLSQEERALLSLLRSWRIRRARAA